MIKNTLSQFHTYIGTLVYRLHSQKVWSTLSRFSNTLYSVKFHCRVSTKELFRPLKIKLKALEREYCVTDHIPHYKRISLHFHKDRNYQDKHSNSRWRTKKSLFEKVARILFDSTRLKSISNMIEAQANQYPPCYVDTAATQVISYCASKISQHFIWQETGIA